MNLLHSVIFATLLTVLSVSAESAESKDVEAFLLEQAKICQMETNATDNDVDELLNGGEANTAISKCLLSCLMKKLGVMNQDNKLEIDNLNKLIADDTIKSKDGKSIKSVMKTVGENCKSVTSANPCDAGVEMIRCLNAEANKLGFDNPF